MDWISAFSNMATRQNGWVVFKVHEAAVELKSIISGIFALLVGALSWMIKAKISRTDKRLDDLEAWKTGVDVGIGEFQEVKKQVADLKKGQDRVLEVLLEIRRTTIREGSEDRRRH